jgi:hypothetical protein
MSLADNRVEPRIEKLSFITFVNREGGEQKTPVSMGRTLNISQTGVGVEIFQAVVTGSVMEMEIALSHETIPVNGKVVHSYPLPNGAYYIGILFDQVQQKLASVVLAQSR